MKKIISVFVALLMSLPLFAAQGRYPYLIGSDFGHRGDGTVQKIITQLGGKDGIIVLDNGIWNFTNAITIPANIHLDVPYGSTIKTYTNIVYTFSGGPFSAENAPVFTGHGTVTGYYNVAVSMDDWFLGFNGTIWVTNSTGLINLDDLSFAVATNVLGEGDITSWHILDGTITSSDIATNTITGANIATNTITGDHIATNTITGDHIATNTITSNQITAETIGLFSGGSLPVGTILPFAGRDSSLPGGFLMCDGSAYTTNSYPALFAVIGTAWGNGTDFGGHDFNVPDLRGTFLRGDNDMYDKNGGYFTNAPASSDQLQEWRDKYQDPDSGDRTRRRTGGAVSATVGSYQTHKIDLHRHRIGGLRKTRKHSSTQDTLYWGGSKSKHTDEEGGNETRPVNASVKFIIKY
jgi:hypothetical protein